MAEAEIAVTFAGPLVTFQDAGRPGHMRYGVPASGPMDRLAFDAAHAALGNAGGGTAIEISLGGLMLHCRAGAVSVAITGGDFDVLHNGHKSASWTILTLRQGDKLHIRGGASGSWAYLAFAGAVAARTWLGHSATLASSGFGGGALQSGQRLTLHDTAIREDREGTIERPDRRGDRTLRAVIGPQDQEFTSGAVDTFLSDPFTVSDAYDRMGMRLNGSTFTLKDALSIPSEPIVRGAVQVSGDGVATVLLADHQTTGGYPKIATVITCDLDRLVQARAGQPVRFTRISAADAITATRADAAQRAAHLARISVARGTLEQRLMRENLNHGMIFD